MPSARTPKCHNFETVFNDARDRVEDLFALGRRARQRTVAVAVEKKEARAAKQVYKKPPACQQIAEEYSVGISTVYSARTAAAAFPDRTVREILATLHEAGIVPSVEQFRLWSTLPPEDRVDWINLTIANRWTCAELQLEIISAFPNRSNGGKQPDPPKSEQEALLQVEQMQRRLNAMFARLLHLRRLEDGGPSFHEGLAVRDQVLAELDQVVEHVQRLDWTTIPEEESEIYKVV